MGIVIRRRLAQFSILFKFNVVSIYILIIINKFNIKKFLPYLIVGIFVGFITHNSGIHATIAGVLLAMTIPRRKKEKDFSLLIKIEHAISPYVAFGIMHLYLLLQMQGFL